MLYNAFDHFVQHCYLLYNIVTDVQRYNLYNQDKKIVQTTKKVYKGFDKYSFLYCTTCCTINSKPSLMNCTTFIQTFCTILVNVVVQIVQLYELVRSYNIVRIVQHFVQYCNGLVCRWWGRGPRARGLLCATWSWNEMPNTKITQALRKDFAGISQKLRNHYAGIA